MPQYECAVVLAPTLSDEQVQEQTELIKTWITGLGAQVTAVDVWGRKRMVYPIRKHREGIYIIYYFTFDQGQSRLSELSKRASTTEAILRQLVVRLPTLKEPPRLPTEEEEEEGEEGMGPRGPREQRDERPGPELPAPKEVVPPAQPAVEPPIATAEGAPAPVQ